MGKAKGKEVNKRSPCKDHLGKEYKTITDMCRQYNMSRDTFKARIKSGWNLQDALTRPRKLEKKQCRDHLGNCYETATEMCKQYNIAQPLFIYRINKLHWDIERALTTSIKGQEGSVKDHLGNGFNSEREMGEYYGIPYGTFTARKRKGWSIEKILTTPAVVKNIKIVVFGKEYKSIIEVEKYFNMPEGIITHRLRDSPRYKDFDLEMLVSIKDLKSIQLKFIGLDGQARYKVPWHQDYQTTREIIRYQHPELLSLYDKSHPDGKWNPYRRQKKVR